MTQPNDLLRGAIQHVLDQAGDGWTLAEHVICMWIERVNTDGTVDQQPWYLTPPGQGDHKTKAIIESCLDIHEWAEADDD